jgi:hypothetical protein
LDYVEAPIHTYFFIHRMNVARLAFDVTSLPSVFVHPVPYDWSALTTRFALANHMASGVVLAKMIAKRYIAE